MEDKNQKVIQVALWGFTMIIIITGCLIFKSLSSKVDENNIVQNAEVKTSNVIVYDGSENNPYIQGVQ